MVVATVAAVADVQVEWRREAATLVGPNWGPAPTYVSDYPAEPANTIALVQPPTDLAYGTWWIRVRVGDSSTNTWSAWSTQNWIDLRPILGSTAQYLDLNIGVTAPPVKGAFQYLEMNVSPLPIQIDAKKLTRTLEMNVGVKSIPLRAAEFLTMNVGAKLREYVSAEYMELGVDPDAQPTPHIWWIRPEEGKEGYVFNIYGHGFGEFQGQFDGTVKLGNLTCAVARWEIIPADVRISTATVAGTPPTAPTTTNVPNVLLNSRTHIVQAGDIIEFDVRWETPPGTRIDIFPYFTISGSSNPIGYGSALLNDIEGMPWITDLAEAYGAWKHRRFIVPPGHYLIGRTITNFGIGWYGSDATKPVRKASVRSFVVRGADEVPILWATGDDQKSAPPFTYTAGTGTLSSTAFQQQSHYMQHGQSLDPDVITPEHGWIVAVVPSGAVSSMVRVSLEDN